MKANDGQCLTLVSFSASNSSAVVLTLLDGKLADRRYLPNNVGTHLQLSILRQIMGKLNCLSSKTEPCPVWGSNPRP